MEGDERMRMKRRLKREETLIEKRESGRREEEEGEMERACHEEVHGREVYEG